MQTPTTAKRNNVLCSLIASKYIFSTAIAAPFGIVWHSSDYFCVECLHWECVSRKSPNEFEKGKINVFVHVY